MVTSCFSLIGHLSREGLRNHGVGSLAALPTLCPVHPSVHPSRRSVRDSEHEEDEDERKQSRGCALQYQHSTLQVFTQFHTTAAEGTGQVVTMLGPD